MKNTSIIIVMGFLGLIILCLIVLSGLHQIYKSAYNKGYQACCLEYQDEIFTLVSSYYEAGYNQAIYDLYFELYPKEADIIPIPIDSLRIWGLDK